MVAATRTAKHNGSLAGRGVHLALPRSIWVESDDRTLRGSYSLLLDQDGPPIWRMQGHTNAELSYCGSTRRWTLRSTFGHSLSSSSLLGRWSDTVSVAAVHESPSLVGRIAFPAPQMDFGFYDDGGLGRVDRLNGVQPDGLLRRRDLLCLVTSHGEQIPALHRVRAGAAYTVIYSHGNAEDLGLLLPLVDGLSEALNASVLAYEYVGYSTSRLEGRAPSEAGCCVHKVARTREKRS
jgi:hypothetical protein